MSVACPKSTNPPMMRCFTGGTGRARGAIAGVVLGLLILILGFAWLANIHLWNYVGPFAVIIVGILIIAGVAYGATRRS